MDLKCPRGHSQIRKVSGIYKEQGRLSPPEAPQHERLMPANPLNIPMLHFLGHIVGYPMAWAFFFLTVLLACGSFGVGTATGAGTGVFLFVLGGLLIVGGIIWKARAKAAVHRAVYEDEYPRWQRAYKRWDQLYYCQVCDTVFVPNSQSPSMTEEEMHQFLYAD